VSSSSREWAAAPSANAWGNCRWVRRHRKVNVTKGPEIQALPRPRCQEGRLFWAFPRGIPLK